MRRIAFLVLLIVVVALGAWRVASAQFVGTMTGNGQMCDVTVNCAPVSTSVPNSYPPNLTGYNLVDSTHGVMVSCQQGLMFGRVQIVEQTPYRILIS